MSMKDTLGGILINLGWCEVGNEYKFNLEETVSKIFNFDRKKEHFVSGRL